MSKREDFITIRVSKEEKEEIREMAKGMGNITVSEFVRHRTIRPMMTIPEMLQNIKLYVDSKFNSLNYNNLQLYIDNKLNNLTKKIIENIKEQDFFQKPLQKRMTIIEEYAPIKEIIKHPPPKVINIDKKILEKTFIMRKVLKEMSKREFILNEVPLEIFERERPIPDPIAYLEWKIEVKGRKRLRESSVFLS